MAISFLPLKSKRMEGLVISSPVPQEATVRAIDEMLSVGHRQFTSTNSGDSTNSSDSWISTGTLKGEGDNIKDLDLKEFYLAIPNPAGSPFSWDSSSHTVRSRKIALPASISSQSATKKEPKDRLASCLVSTTTEPPSFIASCQKAPVFARHISGVSSLFNQKARVSARLPPASRQPAVVATGFGDFQEVAKFGIEVPKLSLSK